MKCHNCQYEITGQVKFCPACGAQISTEHRDTFSDNILTVKERLAEHRLDSVRAV